MKNKNLWDLLFEIAWTAAGLLFWAVYSFAVIALLFRLLHQ
jgi:hypothetical protein